MIIVDRISQDNLYGRTFSEVIRLEFDKNSVSPFALIQVVMSEKWYENLETFGMVCAFAGAKGYQNNMGYDIAEKPWKWGDVALEFAIEYASEMADDYEEFIRFISMHGVIEVSDYEMEEEN
jgi:hypothetical protein